MFKKIPRWPDHHDRNIDIAIKVALGIPAKKIAAEYGVSPARIHTIFRIAAFYLTDRKVFRAGVDHRIGAKSDYDVMHILELLTTYKQESKLHDLLTLCN